MDALMREKLEDGGSVKFSPRGTSMLPMLRSSGDSVTLVKPPARMKRGTVALFLSEGEDGARKYVLHRLVRIRKGRYVFLGDNRIKPDPDAESGDVIGVVADFRRRGRAFTGREFLWRLYSGWMVATRGVRRPALGLQHFVYGIWKKLKGKRQ